MHWALVGMGGLGLFKLKFAIGWLLYGGIFKRFVRNLFYRFPLVSIATVFKRRIRQRSDVFYVLLFKLDGDIQAWPVGRVNGSIGS